MPFLKGQMVTEPDGSLLIKDVPMLAEGNWTDSAVRTPLFYPAKILEQFSGNWIDTTGWSRHLGGTPRDSTDKVAEATNPHYGQFAGKDGQMHNAILSDVRIHPFTQKSRDMQELIRHNLIQFVSVEHGGEEKMNPDTRQMEASSLVFAGFAFVNKGACKLCRVNEEPVTLPPAKPADDTMDTKELEAKLEAVTKELEAVKAQKPVEVVKTEIPRELADTLKALTDKVKALESQPAAPVTAPAAPARELAEPEFVATFDRKSRIARGA